MQIYAGLFYKKCDLSYLSAGEGVGAITAEDEDLEVTTFLTKIH